MFTRTNLLAGIVLLCLLTTGCIKTEIKFGAGLNAQSNNASNTPGITYGEIHYNTQKREYGRWVKETQRIYVDAQHGVKELPDGRAVIYEIEPGHWEITTRDHWQRQN